MLGEGKRGGWGGGGGRKGETPLSMRVFPVFMKNFDLNSVVLSQYFKTCGRNKLIYLLTSCVNIITFEATGEEKCYFDV